MEMIVMAAMQGLPRSLDETTWRRMQEMSDEDFLHHMRAVRPRGADRDRSRADDRSRAGDRRQRRDGREDFSRNRPRDRRF